MDQPSTVNDENSSLNQATDQILSNNDETAINDQRSSIMIDKIKDELQQNDVSTAETTRLDSDCDPNMDNPDGDHSIFDDGFEQDPSGGQIETENENRFSIENQEDQSNLNVFFSMPTYMDSDGDDSTTKTSDESAKKFTGCDLETEEKYSQKMFMLINTESDKTSATHTDAITSSDAATTIINMDINDLSSPSSSDDKKRLRLEDFMRQIITQINTSSEKIWPNLLLDFTKNFAEFNIPTYVLQLNHDYLHDNNIAGYGDCTVTGTGASSIATSASVLNCNRFVSNSDQDLLMDILNIATSSLSMPQTDRRVFACQLLLNIHDCLTMDTIQSKVMPLLSEIVTKETTTSVRFTVCFVLSNYARRVEFDYFQSIIFPLFEKLSCIAMENTTNDQKQVDQKGQYSLCTSTTICFALLDSLTSLLSYLLHFNQMLMKKRQHSSKTKVNDQKNDDDLCNDDADSNSNNEDDINQVFKFTQEKFLPLLKKIFQSMLSFIEQYRSMSMKIEQDLFNCFLHWRDQIGTHDSISQTLFSHFQSLILFVLILRDFSNTDANQSDLIDQPDEWYLDFYYRLCAFHYVLPKPTDYSPTMTNQTMANTTVQEQAALKDSLLIDQSTHSILTKINLMDLGRSSSNAGQNADASSLYDSIANSGQNFIGRFQVKSDNNNSSSSSSTVIKSDSPSSILQQNLQQTTTTTTTSADKIAATIAAGLAASNVTLQNNDFSIGSTQYTFSSNALNNFDIFGFFRYKTIACKIILVALVPAISDLYCITKNSNLLLAKQQQNSPTPQQQSKNIPNTEISRNAKKLLQPSNLSFPADHHHHHHNHNHWSAPIGESQPATVKLGAESKPESNIELPFVEAGQITGASASAQVKEQIITRLIDILNTLSIDNNYEITIKMANIIEKLVERFTEPIRLYSLLINIMQSQNFDVIGHLIKNFYSVFSSMLSSSSGNNPNTNTIIEYVIETFLRSESYLSTKPKWRLHILYFDVLFRLSRMVPVDIVQRLIIPRLLLRFSTTRAIPCRQAVARCLLLVYIENFAEYDFQKFYRSSAKKTDQQPTGNDFLALEKDDDPAHLSFDLFNWLDRNLKQSNKYQDRQLYIDLLAILLKFLFRDSIESYQQPQSSLANHYLVDLQELCPSLMDTQHLWHRFCDESRSYNLKDPKSSQLFAVILIQRYGLLHLITEMCTKDRVGTIRASACTVLYSLLLCVNHWVVDNLHRLPQTSVQQNPEEEDCIESLMEYYDSYMENSEDNSSSTLEHVYRRLQTETDGIVLEELNKVFMLADDFRLDFSLNYYQLRNKRKKPRKNEDCLEQQKSQQLQTTPETDIVSLTTTSSSNNIDTDVIELINELLMYVETIDAQASSPIQDAIKDDSSDQDVDLSDGFPVIDSHQVGDYGDQQKHSNPMEPGTVVDMHSTTVSVGGGANRCRGLIYISSSEIEKSSCSTTVEPNCLPSNNNGEPKLTQPQPSSKTISPKKRKSPKHGISSNNLHSTNHQSKGVQPPLKTCSSVHDNNSNNDGNKTEIGQGSMMVDSNMGSDRVSESAVVNKLNHSSIINNKLKTSKGNQIANRKQTAYHHHHHHHHHPPPPSRMASGNVALLPTPMATEHQRTFHHHLGSSSSSSSSKVPVLNNRVVPPLPAHAASNASYPGIRFRIVYPPAPPPPPVPPVQFCAGFQAKTNNHLVPSSSSSQRYPSGSPVSNHHHFHHHNATGSGSAAQFKLPKTTTINSAAASVLSGVVSNHRSQSVSPKIFACSTDATGVAQCNKRTGHNNNDTSINHHHHHHHHQSQHLTQYLHNRSLSVLPIHAVDSPHRQQQPAKIKNSNKKIFKTLDQVSVGTSSVGKNFRQNSSTTDINSNTNINNNGFGRVKKFKKKLEHLTVSSRNVATHQNSSSNKKNNHDLMETDDFGNNNLNAANDGGESAQQSEDCSSSPSSSFDVSTETSPQTHFDHCSIDDNNNNGQK